MLGKAVTGRMGEDGGSAKGSTCGATGASVGVGGGSGARGVTVGAGPAHAMSRARAESEDFMGKVFQCMVATGRVMACSGAWGSPRARRAVPA